MGKQTDTQLEGTFGDIICYKWRDKYLVRSKGRTGTQALVAKMQAGILGKASALSARIRSAVKPLLPDPKSRELMYRLNNTLQQWLRITPPGTEQQLNNISSINGFSFTENHEMGTMFYAAMPVSRTNEGNLSLYIPAFDSPNPIAPLPFSGQINFKIIGVACNLNNTDDIEKYETVLDIHYNGTPVASQQVELPLQTRKGKLVVVAVSVNEAVAGIVGAFYN